MYEPEMSVKPNELLVKMAFFELRKDRVRNENQGYWRDFSEAARQWSRHRLISTKQRRS